MTNFSLLPPEINSQRIFSGAGSAFESVISDASREGGDDSSAGGGSQPFEPGAVDRVKPIGASFNTGFYNSGQFNTGFFNSGYNNTGFFGD